MKLAVKVKANIYLKAKVHIYLNADTQMIIL